MEKTLFVSILNRENLLKARFCCLLLLIFFLPMRKCQFPISVSLTGFLAISAVLFFKEGSKESLNISYFVPMALICVLVLVSLVFTDYPGYVLKKSYQEIILPFLTFFMLLAFPLKRRQVELAIGTLLLSLAVASLIAFYEVGSPMSYRRPGYLVGGGAGEMAAWFTMGFPYIVTIKCSRISEKIRLILMFCLGVLYFLALLSTKTRASLLGFIIMLLFAALLHRKMVVTLGIILAVAIVLFVSSLFGHRGRLGLWKFMESGYSVVMNFSTKTPDEIMSLYDAKDSSLSRRLAMWKQALIEVSKSPFRLRGYGNIFGRTMDKKYRNHKSFFYRNLHSEPLTLLFGLGIIGFSLSMWLLFLVFKENWITNFSFSSHLPKILKGSTILMSVSLIVSTSFWVYRKEVFIGYWILVGLSYITNHRFIFTDEKEYNLRSSYEK